MPAQSNPLGIKSIGITLAQKFDVEKKLTESAPLLDKDGKFVEGDARDPIWDFSIDGKGDLPAGLVAGSNGGEGLAIAGVEAGKTILEKVNVTEHHDTWNEWKVSGKNFPSAA
jgi:hypothetical protein